MTGSQALTKPPASAPAKKARDDKYVPVKADPPEIRGELGAKSKSKSPIPTLLERLGPDANEFSSDAPQELVDARLTLLDWLNNVDPDMPFKPFVEVDMWLGRAMAERIRGEDIRNRKLTDAQIETLQADMLRPGAWKYNGDTIRFTHNGQVIDGQGRLIAHLLACRKDPSAKFVTNLLFNVPKESFSTIDTGRKRTGADVLGMMDISQGFLKSAIARMWYNYHKGRMRNQVKVTPDQVREIVLENQKLFDDAVHIIAPCLKAKELKLPGAVMGMVCALGLRTDQAKTAQFFHQLATGLNLNETDPVYLFRRAIANKQRMVRGGAPRVEVAAMLVKALNLYFQKDLPRREDEKPAIIRWVRGEAFPRFVGDRNRKLWDDSLSAEDEVLIDVEQVDPVAAKPETVRDLLSQDA